VSYEVKPDPEVEDDLRQLAADQAAVPADWRMSEAEVNQAIDQAILIMKSLQTDPYQGDIMRGKEKSLEGCRRLKFDPADHRDHRGRPRPRMRIVWANEPGESAIAYVRVLAVTHRWKSAPYKRAASRR
jgi:hypothetical protein